MIVWDGLVVLVLLVHLKVSMIRKQEILLTSIFGLNCTAQLLSCSNETESPKVCFTGNTSNLDPFPMVLNTELVLQEIVGIDENEKSISIQMRLVSIWKVSGLDRSTGTKK